MPITAGGTGAIETDGFGNHVAELASGRNSHGGGRCGVLTHMTDQCETLDESSPFLPTGWQADRIGDLPAPESEVDVSDSESEVDYIEPDSAPLQITTTTTTTTTAVELLCPPVVTQTRPMEGCDPASPRRLRRGRDVLTEDGTVAVDNRQVSAASDTVGVSGIHMTSECILTVMPKLASAPQAASEVVQTRPRGYCCMDLLPPVGEGIESLDVDAPDAVASGKEAAGGSSKVGSDSCMVPDVLQTAVSVMTVVSEKWMERFILNLDVLGSDVLASSEDPAEGSLDVGSDICVVPDPLPTVVSVRTVIAEKWMDWFVLDLVECPSVSRTSAVARTFGPAVSEEYSPVVLAGGRGGGGEVADAYPLVVVESDTAQVSGLHMVESDTARVSILPVAGCKFMAVFLGKVALDVVGLGVGPPCLRVDSEETLLTLMDEQAQLVRAAPGVTPVDRSEEWGANPGTDRAFGSGKAPG